LKLTGTTAEQELFILQKVQLSGEREGRIKKQKETRGEDVDEVITLLGRHWGTGKKKKRSVTKTQEKNRPKTGKERRSGSGQPHRKDREQQQERKRGGGWIRK